MIVIVIITGWRGCAAMVTIVIVVTGGGGGGGFRGPRPHRGWWPP